MGWVSTLEDSLEALEPPGYANTPEGKALLEKLQNEARLRTLVERLKLGAALLDTPPHGNLERELQAAQRVSRTLEHACQADAPRDWRALEIVERRLRREIGGFGIYSLIGATYARSLRSRVDDLIQTHEQVSALVLHNPESEEPAAKLKQLRGALDDHVRLIDGIPGLWNQFLRDYRRAAAHQGTRPKLGSLNVMMLDRAQDAFVSQDYRAEYRVLGASGSGKTAILLHRALRLALEDKTRIVRVFTLNRALAKHLEDAIADLNGSKPENIHVHAVYDFLVKILRRFAPEDRWALVDDRSGERAVDSWREYFANAYREVEGISSLYRHLNDRGIDPAEYLRAEMRYIQGAFPILNRDSYLSSRRTGRAIPLLEDARRACLELASGWEAWLRERNLCDVEGVSAWASVWFEDDAQLAAIRSLYPTQYVLVDECQDVATIELRMLRRLIHESSGTRNAWFLVGDLNQKIHVRPHDSVAAGFRFTGRSRRLHRSYRNTREILAAAFRLAERYQPVLDEVEETIVPELSPYRGSKPLWIQFSEHRHLTAVLSIARSRVHGTLALVSENHRLRADLYRNLRNGGDLSRLFSNEELDRWDEAIRRDPAAALVDRRMALASMEAVKGYEYDTVVFCDFSARIVPRASLPHEEHWRDAARTYVAMTRARHELIITSVGAPSPFLSAMDGEVARFHKYDPTDDEIAIRLGTA